jgi:hypothetical protein
MTPNDLKQVVAKIQLGDNRQVDALTLREWFDTIGHLDADDALRAVTMHRQESPDYLQPFHIITNARRIRNERAELTGSTMQEYESHPKPANYEAMAAAWNDPQRFAAEVGIYNEQLRAGGHPTVSLNERRGHDY